MHARISSDHNFPTDILTYYFLFVFLPIFYVFYLLLAEFKFYQILFIYSCWIVISARLHLLMHLGDKMLFTFLLLLLHSFLFCDYLYFFMNHCHFLFKAFSTQTFSCLIFQYGAIHLILLQNVVIINYP